MSEPARPLLCRQWFGTLGTMSTLVVAATKEDALILARQRMTDAGRGRGERPRIREATTRDVAVYEEALRREVEWAKEEPA